jgi:hypothetical protein
MNKKKATLMVTMICGTLGAQELPLQKEEDRAVLRRQSGMVFDIVSPAALQAGKSTVWIWVGGKRQLCVGTVVGDGEGGYRLEGSVGPDGEPWRLITLEPALNEWLCAGPPATPVALIGCANPWGPWLRVSRLAD